MPAKPKVLQTKKLVVDLKGYLDKIGMSQRKLSEKTGIRFATINDICRGLVSYIHQDNIALICQVLDCSPWDFIRLEDMTPEEIAEKRAAQEEKSANHAAANKVIAHLPRKPRTKKKAEGEE